MPPRRRWIIDRWHVDIYAGQGAEDFGEPSNDLRTSNEVGPHRPPERQPDRGTPMRRAPSLALVCLTLFVVLLPATLAKPGIPMFTKADETAYYLAALSLWRDGDWRCEDHDVRRLFREFIGSDNLLVMSKGRGEPVYFSVPVVYPLLATPFVGIWGANGMTMLNAALLMAMIWMGAAYLRRWNGEAISTLFASGYFLLSTAFVYVFWLQGEVLTMACVMGAFFLLTDEPLARAEGAARRWLDRLGVRAAGAAALIATAAYSKPMLLVLALPLIHRLVAARARRALLTFAAAGVATIVVWMGTAFALTEQIWPYFAPRVGGSVTSPVDYVARRIEPQFPKPENFEVATPAQQVARSGREVRVTGLAIVAEAVPEFLFGRHGGVAIYMPFAVLCVLYFLGGNRRSWFGWLTLLAAAMTAVLFMVVVRGQWLGGGGFVGNRYFTAVYPVFFFLVRELRPSWPIAIGYAAAAVFLGPLLITPLGAMVHQPSLQAHVRNAPYQRLPFEWSLSRALSSFRNVPHGGVQVHGRRDEVEVRQKEIWIQGAKRVELNLLSASAARGFVFDVRSIAPGNDVEICLQRDCRRLSFGDVPAEGRTERVFFEPRDGVGIPRSGWDVDAYRFPLTVESTWGEQPRWRSGGDEAFYLGAALVLLGTPEEIGHDLYDLSWESVEVPRTVTAGRVANILIRVRNRSAHPWPSAGPTRVGIGHRWLDSDHEGAARGGKRTPLAADVEPGEVANLVVEVAAPVTPGTYRLALDLVRERVRWFSRDNAAQVHTATVEVVADEHGGDFP